MKQTKRKHRNIIKFPKDPHRAINIQDLRAAVEEELQAGIAAPVTVILYNELQTLLDAAAPEWTSDFYTNQDLYL